MRGRVHALVAEGHARFSDWVRLELWTGIGEAERRWLRQMESLVETAPTDAAVWDLARDEHFKKTLQIAAETKA